MWDLNRCLPPLLCWWAEGSHAAPIYMFVSTVSSLENKPLSCTEAMICSIEPLCNRECKSGPCWLSALKISFKSVFGRMQECRTYVCIGCSAGTIWRIVTPQEADNGIFLPWYKANSQSYIIIQSKKLPLNFWLHLARGWCWFWLLSLENMVFLFTCMLTTHTHTHGRPEYYWAITAHFFYFDTGLAHMCLLKFVYLPVIEKKCCVFSLSNYLCALRKFSTFGAVFHFGVNFTPHLTHVTSFASFCISWLWIECKIMTVVESLIKLLCWTLRWVLLLLNKA